MPNENSIPTIYVQQGGALTLQLPKVGSSYTVLFGDGSVISKTIVNNAVKFTGVDFGLQLITITDEADRLRSQFNVSVPMTLPTGAAYSATFRPTLLPILTQPTMALLGVGAYSPIDAKQHYQLQTSLPLSNPEKYGYVGLFANPGTDAEAQVLDWKEIQLEDRNRGYMTLDLAVAPGSAAKTYAAAFIYNIGDKSVKSKGSNLVQIPSNAQPVPAALGAFWITYKRSDNEEFVVNALAAETTPQQLDQAFGSGGSSYGTTDSYYESFPSPAPFDPDASPAATPPSPATVKPVGLDPDWLFYGSISGVGLVGSAVTGIYAITATKAAFWACGDEQNGIEHGQPGSDDLARIVAADPNGGSV